VPGGARHGGNESLQRPDETPVGVQSTATPRHSVPDFRLPADQILRPSTGMGLAPKSPSAPGWNAFFVKCWVDFLHRQMAEGELSLSGEIASKLIVAGNQALKETPGGEKGELQDF